LEQEAINAKIREYENSSPFIDFDKVDSSNVKTKTKKYNSDLSTILLDIISFLKTNKKFRNPHQTSSREVVSNLEVINKQLDEFDLILKTEKSISLVKVNSNFMLAVINSNELDSSTKHQLKLTKLKLIEILRLVIIRYYNYNPWELGLLSTLSQLELDEIYQIFIRILNAVED